MATSPLVELRRVSKSFGNTHALRDVSFELQPGEVHVLAGANGAGKSTLIRVLSGVHTDYTGALLLDGQPTRLAGPRAAAAAGIATIHQELSLVQTMSVADNLWLGRDPGSLWGRVSRRARERAARDILAEMQLDVAPTQLVEQLPLAVRQLLEIGRSLAGRARIIIMDEPTSALGEREADELFARVEHLRSQGTGIIYISHRMEEIFRIADRISALRDGRLVLTSARDDLSADELVAAIVGRAVRESPRAVADSSPQSVLRVGDLTVADPMRPGRRLVDRVSLDLRRGEILGLAGLRGSGTSALLHGLYGSRGPAGGTVELSGQPLRIRGPADAIARGVILLTADRRTSVVQDLSVLHNATLSSLHRVSEPWRAGWVSRAKERRAVEDVVRNLRLVAPSLEAPAATLSGGNQQKVALARCLLTRPRLLLLDEPTRGIDVGAKADIYDLIRKLASQGVAILLVASEMDELLALSDRIAVLHRGRQVGLFPRGETTRDQLLHTAMGIATS